MQANAQHRLSAVVRRTRRAILRRSCEGRNAHSNCACIGTSYLVITNIGASGSTLHCGSHQPATSPNTFSIPFVKIVSKGGYGPRVMHLFGAPTCTTFLACDPLRHGQRRSWAASQLCRVLTDSTICAGTQDFVYGQWPRSSQRIGRLEFSPGQSQLPRWLLLAFNELFSVAWESCSEPCTSAHHRPRPEAIISVPADYAQVVVRG